MNYSIEDVEKHIKTHSECSAKDDEAVTVLKNFLRSRGRINTHFSSGDKWPNIDGTFEYVPNPDHSRRPAQVFTVQIKGTHSYYEENGVVKYRLTSLAAPAYACMNVTHDPVILFVVFNLEDRGNEKVFWKYLSVSATRAIDFSKDSCTIYFYPDEEIENNDESILKFCSKLEEITEHHSYITKLENREYGKEEAVKILNRCNEEITENLDLFDTNSSRDYISKRLITKLRDLCSATLLLCSINDDDDHTNLRVAWEKAILNTELKYLGDFLKSIDYIDMRVPDDGQSERIMLKFYDILWHIRNLLYANYGIKIINNLEKFPLYSENAVEREYYKTIAKAVDTSSPIPGELCASRYYVQKKTPFFVDGERYFEVTLQLAELYATKYNRVTAYTKLNIVTGYSIQIGYSEEPIELWDINLSIKVVNNWRVSISPVCINKLAKILRTSDFRLSSRYGEYFELMKFLTNTGMSLLELIDRDDDRFNAILESIYSSTKTMQFRNVLLRLHNDFKRTSDQEGHNTIRYLLTGLREETLMGVMPSKFDKGSLCPALELSSKCFPFEHNPYVSNLPGSKTVGSRKIREIIDSSGKSNYIAALPYIRIVSETNRTGEIYVKMDNLISEERIDKYNENLDSWESRSGFLIKKEKEYAYIDSFEQTTRLILSNLIARSKIVNKGQREFNRSFVEKNKGTIDDSLKEKALEKVFVNSRVMLIYGAAGTGKTTLVNLISNMFIKYRKLFLTKTHTALQNLKRRIENPGPASDFISIDSFTKRINPSDYDVVFVDECSTIDNRTMKQLLDRVSPDTFLVLAGDVYQLESIEFGNWFYYAKEIINAEGANVELLSTWRTDDKSLKTLWKAVRENDDNVEVMLAIDGPYSKDIGADIFTSKDEDEVILCLNYDGKFGLNNMNSYFQIVNSAGPLHKWQEWSYKQGDPILFIDTKRFPLLYNNLKGRIVDIEDGANCITFTVDADIIFTEKDCEGQDFQFIEVIGNKTRIRFTVFSNEGYLPEDVEEDIRLKSVVPFQLAYAVSIHKAQGLEYNSVKVIIPDSNSERITHGVFYTAITRAVKHLKIYCSSNTIHSIVSSFYTVNKGSNSLGIIRNKLGLK